MVFSAKVPYQVSSLPIEQIGPCAVYVLVLGEEQLDASSIYGLTFVGFRWRNYVSLTSQLG